MKKDNFEFELTDSQAIDSISNGVSMLAKSLNIGVELFIERVGSFNLELFLSIYNRKARKADLVKMYISLHDINVGHLDLQKVIDLQLIPLPDFSQLMSYVADQKRIVYGSDYSGYLKDISELYSPKLNRFVELGEDDENEVYKMIISKNTISCESEEEMQFVNDLQTFADLYAKFRFTYRLDTGDAPRALFTAPQNYKTGEVIVNINPWALQRFKNNRAGIE